MTMIRWLLGACVAGVAAPCAAGAQEAAPRPDTLPPSSAVVPAAEVPARVPAWAGAPLSVPAGKVARTTSTALRSD